MSKDWLRVRNGVVSFHLLREGSGRVAIDAGFVGGSRALIRALAGEPLHGILITHGHLDHITCVSELARRTGAWIAAPKGDADRYAGRPADPGPARFVSWVERIAGPWLGFRPFVPDRWIGDGDEIDVWGGLTAVSLPGHTTGHTGYLSRSRRLLFCGDLFASFPRLSHFPPRILNAEPQTLRASVSKVLAMDLEGIIPNHGDAADPSVHLARFRRLAEKAGIPA